MARSDAIRGRRPIGANSETPIPKAQRASAARGNPPFTAATKVDASLISCHVRVDCPDQTPAYLPKKLVTNSMVAVGFSSIIQ